MSPSAALPLWLRRLRALRRKLLSRPQPPVRGSVDRVLPNEVIGWAWDQARPDTRLLVEASAGGVVLGRALADLPRRDLVTEGVGDGRHGFRVRLEKPLPPAAQIIVEAVKGWRRTRIQLSAKAYPSAAFEPASPVVATRLQTEVPLAKAKTPAVGFLDRMNGRNLEGWAVNPQMVNGSATIDLYDDEIYLGSVRANLERPRLQESGAPPGARGFSFDLTPVYNAGLLRRVRARIAGTTYDLKRGLHLPMVAEVLERALQLAPIPDAAARNDDRSHEAPSPDLTPVVRERKLLSVLCGGDSIQALVGHGLDSARTLTAGDEGVLTALLSQADLVLFAPADATPAWEGLRVIESKFPAASVFIEGGGDEGVVAAQAAGARAALDLAAWGHAPCLFAVSGPALMRLQGLKPADLIGADWAAVAGRLAAMPRLRWCAVTAGELAEPNGSPVLTTVPACEPGVPMPTRVTLAVRDGWGETPPPALIALIGKCAGLHIDVLAPSRDDASILEAGLRTHASTLASLTYRQVDGFTAGEFWSGLRASAGQALLVATEAAPGASASDVQRLCTWAMRPGVGFVSIGARDEPLADEPSPAEPADLLAFSRQTLAELDIDLSGRLDESEPEFEGLLALRGRIRLHLPIGLDVVSGKLEEIRQSKRG